MLYVISLNVEVFSRDELLFSDRVDVFFFSKLIIVIRIRNAIVLPEASGGSIRARALEWNQSYTGIGLAFGDCLMHFITLRNN